MKTLLFLTCIILLPVFIFAQQDCGTDLTTQGEGLRRMLVNREALASGGFAMARAVNYVPIKFHLVAKDDGTDRVSESRVIDLLCRINYDFAGTDLQFYIDYPFNYIDHTVLFENGTAGAAILEIQSEKVDNAINLFITEKISQQPAIFSFYQGPISENDYLVVASPSIYTSSASSSHALGHFFSLAHTFYGWESNSFDVCDSFMAPDSMGGLPVEKMDLSNCLEAADQICDTPPDYLFAFSFCYDNCTFSGTAYDPCGVVVDPMENNMMSYSFGCAALEFTPDQITAMLLDYESPERVYVQSSYVPDQIFIENSAELFGPISNEEVTNFDEILFEWEDVDGVDYYLLEVDIFPSFSFQPFRLVVDTNFITVTHDFEIGTTHYWRVRGFNDYNNCGAPFSEIGVFKSGLVSGVEINPSHFKIEIYPNPVMDSKVYLQFNHDHITDTNLELFNMEGQLVRKFPVQSSSSSQAIALNLKGLPKGVYVLSGQREGVLFAERLVIL